MPPDYTSPSFPQAVPWKWPDFGILISPLTPETMRLKPHQAAFTLFYVYILLPPDLEADHDVSLAVLLRSFIRIYQFAFLDLPPTPTQAPCPVVLRVREQQR